VAEHYDPKALITLTIAIGQTMFFMPVALIGRPLPGRPGRDLDVAAAGTRQPGSRERGGPVPSGPASFPFMSFVMAA
jgi:hypothetical protein